MKKNLKLMENNTFNNGYCNRIYPQYRNYKFF